MEAIRVLIADDHQQFRAGLRALLASATDLELAGEAGNGEQAIRLATELQPDVIVMDLQMPGVGGIEATRRILHSSPHISVLVQHVRRRRLDLRRPASRRSWLPA